MLKVAFIKALFYIKLQR